MLSREIIAVCSQIHTKHINTVCGQNAELLSVKYRSKLNGSCYSYTQCTITTVWNNKLNFNILHFSHTYLCAPYSTDHKHQHSLYLKIYILNIILINFGS